MTDRVETVADLTRVSLGTRVCIPGLHQPGTDFDAPRVTVTGRLRDIRPHRGGWWLDIGATNYSPNLLDTPLPGTHPAALSRERG